MEAGSRDHLFISYASEDAVFVQWLALKLIAEGYKVWCDRIKLLGGESYPRDVDEAIKKHTFRFISVLSRHSLRKPDPLKERTLALKLAKERGEDFAIPINLDGVSATDLDWMHSDLTYIPFQHGWAAGFRQLLTKLESIRTPKRTDNGRDVVRRWLDSSNIVIRKEERLWSNLVEVLEMPDTMYRYETEERIADSEYINFLTYWPHFREQWSVFWSFQIPPIEFCQKYQLKERGRIENWKTARVLDLNVRNLAVKVFNASFHSLCLSRGLKCTPDGTILYFPPELVANGRLSFVSYDGRSTWTKVVGMRTLRTAFATRQYRYHLAPLPRMWLDWFGKNVVKITVRVFVTTLNGEPVPPRTGLRWRKKSAKAGGIISGSRRCSPSCSS